MKEINLNTQSGVAAKLGQSEKLQTKKLGDEVAPKKDNTISPDATDAVQIAISGANGGELHEKPLLGAKGKL